MTRDNGNRSGTRLAALASEASSSDDQPPGLDRAAQGRLGDNLRAMYDDLIRQPVPDRFKDLLARLDDRDRTKGPGGGAQGN